MISILCAGAGMSGLSRILIASLAALSIGAANGALVAWAKLSPFIVTLAALTYVRGFVYIGTGGQSIFASNVAFVGLGQGSVWGVRIPVLIMILIYVVGWFLLQRTVYGRYVYAVGGNAQAALLAGLPVKTVVISVYMIASFCAAIAGVLSAARIQTAVPMLGSGYELNAIAAVVLGGTSLAGGRGSLLGTFLGVVIIGVLANVLTLMNVPSFYQLVIQGGVILSAVAIDRVRQAVAAR